MATTSIPQINIVPSVYSVTSPITDVSDDASTKLITYFHQFSTTGVIVVCTYMCMWYHLLFVQLCVLGERTRSNTHGSLLLATVELAARNQLYSAHQDTVRT